MVKNFNSENFLLTAPAEQESVHQDLYIEYLKLNISSSEKVLAFAPGDHPSRSTTKL